MIHQRRHAVNLFFHKRIWNHRQASRYGKNDALKGQVGLLNVQLKALTDRMTSLQFQLDGTTDTDFLRRYLNSLAPVDYPSLRTRRFRGK